MTAFISTDCVCELQFVEYELRTHNAVQLDASQDNIVAAGIVVHCSDSDQRLLTILVINQEFISLRVGPNLSSWSRNLLGDARLLAGYGSISLFDGPTAVVTYGNRMCIHSLVDEAAFSRPLLLQHYPSNIGSTHCTPYQHTVWDNSAAQYITYLCLRFHCGDAATTHVQWLVFNTHSLQTILAGDRTGMAGGDKLVPTLQSSGKLAYVVDSEVYLHGVASGIITNQLPGLQHFAHDTVVNCAYASCIGVHKDSHGRGSVSNSRRRVMAVLAMVLNSAGELCCVQNEDKIYSRTLPVQSAGNPQYLFDIKMRVVESATRPLLLLQHHNTLLLLDINNDGAVLREFCNVGAYSCAPFFHPLEWHLLIVPTSQTAKLRLQYVSGGEICCKAGACAVDAASSGTVVTDDTNCNSSLTLNNYFMYELPRATDTVHANQVSRAVSPPCCRSMDPCGLWREDSLMCVDAEAYNRVHWQRIPVQSVHGQLDTPAMETTSATAEECITGKKRGHDCVMDGGTEQRTAAVTECSRDRAVTKCQDRTALLSSLGAHLVQLRHELRTFTATLRYKEGAADYLRSVLINRAAAKARGVHQEDCKTPHSNVCISTGPEREYNPHLQRLRAAEKDYLVPISRDHPVASAVAQLLSLSDVSWTAGGGSSSQACILEEQCPSKCPFLIRSLYSTPLPTQHSLEVSALITNDDTVRDLHGIYLSTYVGVEHSTSGPRLPINVSCESAIVDCLQAQGTCCVKALVTLPANAFTSMQSAALTLHVSVHWRVAVPVAASQDGGTADRSMVMHAGALRIHLADLHTQPHIGVTTGRDRAALEHSAVLAGRSGLPGLPPSAAAAASVTVPVYSYFPRMHIRLSSPLMTQLRAIRALNPYVVFPRQVADQLRAFLRTVQTSTFSIDSVRHKLTAQLSSQLWSQWGLSTSVLAMDSGNARTTQVIRQYSSNVVLKYANKDCGTVPSQGDPTNLSVQELLKLATSTVQVSAVLCATPVAADKYASLGDSLLYLRQLLPNEVTVAAFTGGDGAAELRQAAVSLLHELQLETSAHRARSETTAKDEAVLMQARAGTDVSMAHLYDL